MLKIFEMFSGYGGASFALQKANIPYECIGYSEIYEHAIKLYNYNHPNIKNYGDCTKIIPEELPDFDLLTAGFPCQDVASLGTGNLACGRTILINEVFRIAKIKKPKFIFLENVKGLTHNKHKEFFKHILVSLDELGYNVHWKILNSRDYNTPQNRPRIYFVCIRKDLNLNYRFPEKEIYINDWHNYIDKPENLKKHNKTHFRDYMQMKCMNITNMKYVMCIQTKQDRLPNSGIIDFENYYRLLTPRECFRLQGFFNDEIKFPENEKLDLYKLSGNGWDINIVSKILKCIPFNGEYIKPLRTSLFEDIKSVYNPKFESEQVIKIQVNKNLSPNMVAALKVLETNGKISIDNAAKELLKIHKLRTDNFVQAKKIFLNSNKYGLNTNITKENGIKYVELIFDNTNTYIL